MNKTAVVIGIIIIVTLGIIYAMVGRSTEPVKVALTFEECVAEGNPVMESYPRQCISKAGDHFTEHIGNELEKMDMIRLNNPRPNQEVASPITIKGEARGNWFFEANFPIILTNWDGLIIAEGYATADGEWMTTEFVQFTATITYDYSDIEGGYSNKGNLILKKANASGLPEHDDALEIPIILN